MVLSWYINTYQAPQDLKTSRKTFEIMILLAISWYYHDIVILSWYINIYQAPQHLKTSRKTFEIMILLAISWYYHDILTLSWYINVYQAPQHLKTSRKTFEIMILLVISWYYHDIVILSWYINVFLIKPCQSIVVRGSLHVSESSWSIHPSPNFYCVGQICKLLFFLFSYHVVSRRN